MDNTPSNPVASALLAARGGRRDFVPLARTFLQARKPGGGPGPLSWLVKARRRRALNLYLLVHALASDPPYDVALPAGTWALAVGLSDSPSSRTFISESWTWLERHKLIRTERAGRLRRVWLLDESGSGDPYVHGGARQRRKLDYLKLPYEYWHEGWNERLDLPAIAVLLIGLSLHNTFKLPYERGGQWYGLSRDTIRRGVEQLRQRDLLTMRVIWKPAPLSPTGATEERVYALTGSFHPQRRRSLRASTPAEAG